jgi:hypothetical protein
MFSLFLRELLHRYHPMRVSTLMTKLFVRFSLNVEHHASICRPSSLPCNRLPWIIPLRAAQPRNRGLIPGKIKRLFFSLQRREMFWNLPSLLSDAVEGAVSQGVEGRSVKLTTHPHLLPRLRIGGSVSPVPPVSPEDVVLSWLSRSTSYLCP